jgi:hypothetical protein
MQVLAIGKGFLRQFGRREESKKAEVKSKK